LKDQRAYGIEDQGVEPLMPGQVRAIGFFGDVSTEAKELELQYLGGYGIQF
jgi:hypothetical protein